MSDEENDVNYSDYDEESFDNESIEEVSEYDESVSELSNNDPSVEDQLEESAVSKSLNGSLDNISYEDEEEEVDNDISSSNSVDEDDNAVSTIPDNTAHDTVKVVPAEIPSQTNEHEIDESDSDGSSEPGITITPNHCKSLPGSLANISLRQAPIKVFKKCNQAEQPLSDHSEIEFNVTSRTPTSFNSDNHAFHMDIMQNRTRSSGSIPAPRSRNANRKSLSFSNERMREIERHNQILLKKILTQKPRKEIVQVPINRTTSSAVNRKKQQRQIDMDNQVLKRKIEAISMRRHNNNFYQ